VRTLLATFEAYHDKDFGEVVFDRILIVGDRVLLTGHRGADRFTSVFSVDDRGVRRVQDYAIRGLSPGCVETAADVSEGEADLRSMLETLDPLLRDTLRRVLIHDQADRDAIASQLLRYRDERGDDWADIIDMLTMYPGARRRVIRVLGEIDGR
jgi:hypothetical protein